MTLIPQMKIIIFNSFLALFLLAQCGCEMERVIQKPEAQSSESEAQSSDFRFFNEKEAKETAQKIVQACQEAYEQINDYTAVFYKEEKPDHQKKLRPKDTIFIKFKKPYHIYMKWLKDPNKGMELIYPVKENKILVEAGGLLDIVTPKLYLNPTDKLVTMNNRHPITEAGLGFLIESYVRNFNLAIQDSSTQIKVTDSVPIFERKAVEIEIILPASADYYCHKSIVYFDSETKLITHAEFYDKKGVLFERYSYTQVKINPGLSDWDFNEENPEYDFL